MTRRGRRGMSLVEAIIAVVIFVVIAAGILVSMLMGNRSFMVNDALVHVQEELRRAFDSMSTELREAGGTITVTGGSQLEFQIALGYDLPNPCPDDAVCWGARDSAGADQADWSIRYRLNGTRLVRELLDDGGVVQAGTRALATDAASLAFTLVDDDDADTDPDTIAVQLQITDTRPQLPSGSVSVGAAPITMQVRLRNAG